MYEIFEALLNERGITAYKVSKDTGISTATLSDWKKGRSRPKADKLKLIAEYFNVTVDYLLGNESEDIEKALINDDEDLTEYLEELKSRSEMRMLFKLSKGATKEEVEQAVKIIEALRK